MISPAGAAHLLGADAGPSSSSRSPEKPFGSVLSSLSKTTPPGPTSPSSLEPETRATAQAEGADLSDVAGGSNRPAESHAYGFNQLGMFGLVGPTSGRPIGVGRDATSTRETAIPAVAAPAARTDGDQAATSPPQGELSEAPPPTSAVAAAGAEAELQPNSATGVSIVPVSPLASSEADLGSPAAPEFQGAPEAGSTVPSERPGYQPDAAAAGEVSVLLLPGDGGAEIVTASEHLPTSAKALLAVAIEKLRSEFRITVRSTSHNGEILSPSAPPQPGVAL